MFDDIAEMTDVVSHAVVCEEDKSMLLIHEKNSNLYSLPSSAVPIDSGWKNQASNDMIEIFTQDIQNCNILKMYKVLVPEHRNIYIFNCVYSTLVSATLKNRSKNTYGKYRGKLCWLSETELSKNFHLKYLETPEILEFFALLTGINLINVHNDILIEITDEILIKTESNVYEKTIVQIFTKNVQKALLKQFTLNSFPALYLNQKGFVKFVSNLGWNEANASNLFRVADETKRGALTFKEFLSIIAAIEPNTQHGGPTGELRCRYIFSYYDKDGDNRLNFSEFQVLMNDIDKVPKKLGNSPIDKNSLFRSLDLDQSKNSLGFAGFMIAISNLKIRGTSQIFRSTKSVLNFLNNLHLEFRSKYGNSGKIKADNNWDSGQLKPLPDFIDENKMLYNPYRLGTHMITLQKSGTEINIEEIEGLLKNCTSKEMKVIETSRRFSKDQFDPRSISNEVLKSTRYLFRININKSIPTPNYVMGQINLRQYVDDIVKLCRQVQGIFKQENRLLQISAPVYIMGDFHGNFADLLYFERILWHLSPSLCPCNLLFLGDYVDRGKHGVEVVTYLFSYKLQCPKKVNMLRGNHEIRDIQNNFSFHTECMFKFGEFGNEVWEAINSAFDCMPIAATIENKVFCCHGGIPPPWLCPVASSIDSIPNEMCSPDLQSALAWELMWNDPIRVNHITENVAMELALNEGFAKNTRRGTGHVFSIEALEKFLNQNGFSHMVRAHEVVQAGFNVEHNGKLLTVFSSSRYCGGFNEAACIMADQKKLRVLRLEPS